MIDRTRLLTPRAVAVCCLLALLLFVFPSPASAGEPPDPLFAGWTSNLSSLATRSRVIQVSVIVMCVALAIIMKKFVDVEPPR